MRQLFTILLLIPFSFLKAQDVNLTIYLYDSCSDTVYQANYYTLFSNGKDFESISNGNCVLPDTGKYELRLLEDIEDLPEYFHFQSFESYVDTFRISSIFECLELTTRPSFIGYCFCGNPANGNLKDYYSNGQVRLTGKFKNGNAVGELIYFDIDGNIEKILRYNRKGKLIKEEEF